MSSTTIVVSIFILRLLYIRDPPPILTCQEPRYSYANATPKPETGNGNGPSSATNTSGGSGQYNNPSLLRFLLGRTNTTHGREIKLGGI